MQKKEHKITIILQPMAQKIQHTFLFHINYTTNKNLKSPVCYLKETTGPLAKYNKTILSGPFMTKIYKKRNITISEKRKLKPRQPNDKQMSFKW